MAKKQIAKTTTKAAKTTKASKATKATKATKARKTAGAAPEVEPEFSGNLPLANFLIRLAVDDEFRDRFSQSRMAVNRISADLGDEDRAALLERNDIKILRQLAINNQSTT
jgi:hypothetical protein